MQKKLFIPGYNRHFHYRLTGAGPHVMLIHGLCENNSIWNEIVELLKHSYTLILPDLPGHGLSEEFEDGVYSIEKLQSVMFCIADEEKAVRFSLIGHSMGGYTALAMAEAKPERISRVALLHSTSFADNPEKKKSRERSVKVLEGNRELFFREVFKNLFNTNRLSEFTDRIQQLMNDASSMHLSAVTGTLLGLRDRPERFSFLKKSRFPVSYFIGRFDNVLPADELIQEAKELDAEFLLSETSGHMGFYESPKEMEKFLTDFLQKIF